MTVNVDDIDDLEALLAGLDEDELNASLAASQTAGDSSDDGVDVDPEPEPEPEVVKPAAVAKPVRTRKLKPLVTEETPEAAAAPSAAIPGTELTMEDLATAVIELMATLHAERPDLTEEQVQDAVTPVLNRINDKSSMVKIEAAMRKRVDAIEKQATAEVEPEPAPVTTTASVDDELAALIDDEPEPEPTPEPAKTPVEPEPEVELGDDAELEALLSAAPEATPAPAPVVAPAPTQPLTGAAAAVATRPTKVKAGALKTFIDADQLQADLAFTTTNISLAMTRQAALFAHYSRLAADATYQSDRSKQQVELLEATLNQRFRDSLITAGTKFTEKSIDSMVIQDASYQEAQERAHEARAIAKMVETAADSFRHRKDMLIQVGADLRMEKQGELRMKEHPGEAAKRAMTGE
ncbi:MAG: hypothetical protein RR740_00320 [Pseudomonas sp.]